MAARHCCGECLRHLAQSLVVKNFLVLKTPASQYSGHMPHHSNGEMSAQARRRWCRQYLGTASHRNKACAFISPPKNENSQRRSHRRFVTLLNNLVNQPQTMLHITDAMVDTLVSTDQALQSMRTAFAAFGNGDAAMQARERTDAGGVKLSTLGAVIPALGVTGAKVYTTINGQFNFVILLFSTDTGAPLATMDANAITRLRTAATTVLAAEYLAPPEPQHLFLCGAGVQGMAHAQQFVQHLGVQSLCVFDPYAPADLPVRLAQLTGLPVDKVRRADNTNGVADADIVITASRSKEPLFAGERLKPGAFVAAIGSSLPHTRELDDAALARASVIAVEWKQQSLQEAGDLVLASPTLNIARKVVELGELVSSQHAASKTNTASGDITLYKAVGVGLEDIALAGLAYQNYQKQSSYRAPSLT